jgi:putative PIG3 family NAD(P)H quinone oxidoreductase
VRALTVVGGDLVVADHPDPEPGAGEVLVRVHAAGVNRADLAQRTGNYPAPPDSPADIPGLEFAGEVVAHGARAGAGAPPIGSRVFGLVGGGAHAELLTVPVAQCTEIPSTLDDVHAGGAPEVFMTAHDALVTRAQVARGETVLVHAAGSGVGTAAVQLAHRLRCTTVGTSRSADKLERCRPLGLDHGVVAPRDLDPAALAAEIRAVSGDVDVTIDLVGGPYLATDVRVAALHGRIVLVATQAGATAELDIATTMMKRLRIHGTVLRARSAAEKAAVTAAFARDVVPGLGDGSLRSVVAETFALADGGAAYDRMATDAVFGKIVLDLAL